MLIMRVCDSAIIAFTAMQLRFAGCAGNHKAQSLSVSVAPCIGGGKDWAIARRKIAMKQRSSRQPYSHPADTADLSAAAVTLLVLKGINLLLAQAKQAGLKPVSRILATAREDLADWAADQPDAPVSSDVIGQQLHTASRSPATGQR